MLPKPLQWDRTKARTGVFDGRFIVGVLSTGIYCLPSCSARPPKPENVRVLGAESEAQAMGLRACKRCRPDLFYRGSNADAAIFNGLAERVRQNISGFRNVGALAKSAGISVSKLNGLYRKYARSTPASWLHRQRIDAAKLLLSRDDLRVTDIAIAVGYSSEATFYRQFLMLTKRTPTRYRQRLAA